MSSALVRPGAEPENGLPESVREAASGLLDAESREFRTLVLARLHRSWPDLLAGLRLAYGDTAGPAAATQAAVQAVAAAVARPVELRLLDLQRLVEADWFQQPRMLGYSAYADRFAGTLRDVAARSDYLAELGVTYLHLLPVLASRPGPDDGGYAVSDYRRVRPDLGTVEDLVELTATLRARGISLALDLVLNHVAAEHEWAARARAGEERYRRYFHLFPDRTEPDAYEQTLPEVFPDQAPGSFTWDEEARSWVWTTFNTWQWDLNWHNPEVFHEFADITCFLANAGVEVLRLDAIAFLWKRLGHELPEPAGGARADPGAAGRREDRGPGGAVQGGGDRGSGRPAALPRDRCPPREGQRSRLPQQPHGAGLVDARQW